MGFNSGFKGLIKRVPKPRGSFDISYKSDESCSDVSVCPSKGTRMYRRNVSMDYPGFLAISLPIISFLISKVSKKLNEQLIPHYYFSYRRI